VASRATDRPCAAAGGFLSTPLLAVRNFRRTFGSRVVVEDLSFELGPGDRVALWGPNGAGKTTVLRYLAGTLSATRGEGTIQGHPIGSIRARDRTGVSLSQERSFYMRLSGRANLLFFARLRGLGKGAAARAVGSLEEELELGEILRERADRCSTGMLQQLGFARALLGGPDLLVLDEPTRSLDEQASERLWGALERRSGTAVLLATHRREDLEHCGSRIHLPQ